MRDRQRLLLLDTMSLFHQAYFASQPLRTRDGQPTGALFGFANMVLRILEDERPEALALASDTPTPTFRHEQFPEYKAHRPEPEPDLIAQFPLLDELIEAFGWPLFKLPGYEADDILATLADQAADDWDVFIVTADRDLCQVVTDHVTVLATQGRGVSDVHHFTPEAVTERFGVPPARIPDWKGFVGDSSDNLPGIPGIGVKTATELLQHYGTMEAVLAAADSEQKGKRRENLLAYADQGRLCRELATVRRDVPLDVPLDTLRRREPDEDTLSRLFDRLEFRSLKRRINPRVTTPPKPLTYQPITTPDEAARATAEVMQANVVALAWRARPRGLAVAVAPTRVWYLPLERSAGAQLELFDEGADDQAEAWLAQLTAPLAEGKPWVAHEVQPIYEALGADDPRLANLAGDTHLASWLLDPERAEHAPPDLARVHLGSPPGMPPADLEDPGAWSCCATADLALRLEPRLRELLSEEKLLDLYLQMELPLAPLLARMMAHGVMLDRAQTRALDEELAAGVEAARQAVYEAAGREVNIDSPKQLSELLFGELGLAHGRKTKTGFSTDASVLQTLTEEHPIVQRILDYRELAKLKSTYTEPLLALSDPETGRIRTSLNQTGTSTGRLSSSRPNLQNIPVRGDWGERLRDIFIAPPGHLLLAADYSQIELRVLAHVSGDRRLRQAFSDGLDIHAMAAAEIFGVPVDAVEPEMRRRAKVLNFGVAYGIQAHGLAQRLEITRGEAQTLIDAYFERFPAVKQYAEDTIHRAKEQGYVQTIFGRRRRLPDLTSRHPMTRQAAERAAINLPIQGSASDIIKRAAMALEESLRSQGLGARQVLQVHDELLLEVPETEVLEVSARVKQAMEGAAELDVPLVVKLETGERWGSLSEAE